MKYEKQKILLQRKWKIKVERKLIWKNKNRNGTRSKELQMVTASGGHNIVICAKKYLFLIKNEKEGSAKVQ